MPKVFEYFGIIFFFYSREHKPIHIHVQFAEFESKVVWKYKNGKVVNLEFKSVKGKKGIPIGKRKEIKKFILKYHNQIVEKWIAFFIKDLHPKTEKITKKL